jgi:uncharacterized membrane protein YgcG
MSNIYDILEACLQSLEKGAQMDAVLARYPEYAEELRPLLEASVQARGMAVSDPSREAVQRGRAKLLQRAAEMREAKVSAPRRMIPVFQRFALAFTLAALFLLSGNGLVRASSTALPGENLYPVKRTWEGVRLLFVFDEASREHLEFEFENERLHEVNELLTEGRDEMIRFAGIWLDANGVYYASGIRVVILDTTKLPQDVLQNGAAVIVSGYTNVAGYVEADTIELLPAGANVPMGQPVEVEMEEGPSPKPTLSGVDEHDNSNSNSNDDNSNDGQNSNEDQGKSNGNDNSDEHSNDNSDENGNDHSGKNNNENNEEDNSGHGGGEEDSGGGGEEDSGGGGEDEE